MPGHFLEKKTFLVAIILIINGEGVDNNNSEAKPGGKFSKGMLVCCLVQNFHGEFK